MARPTITARAEQGDDVFAASKQVGQSFQTPMNGPVIPFIGKLRAKYMHRMVLPLWIAELDKPGIADFGLN